MNSVLLRIFRTKSPDSVTADTNLSRCLGIVDLIVIGIGGMIGSGIYVMTGITAKEQAGPSILISFLVASVVVLLVAACFAELAARLHKTGSTYLYLYLTVGELPAVILGISILLSALLSGATNARAWSSYADFLFNSAISNFTETHIGNWDVGPPLARYPDFAAVAVVIVLTLVVALGVKCSARFSAIFVVINVLVLCFVTVCGIVFGDRSNWTSIDENGKLVGFLSHGWAGMLSGAASCFWAFSGFEMITCAVEESRRPQRHIPIAMLLTMIIVTTLYIGTAAGMTLLIPCPLLDTGAPLPSAFAYAGLSWGRYVVIIGPLCGFTTTLISNTFGFVRISLAMAEDGLIWSWFANVNEHTQVPVLSVIICGILEAVIACFCDIRDLISFNVNILLLSYASACMAVVVLRYSDSSSQPTAKKLSTSEGLNLTDTVCENSKSDEESELVIDACENELVSNRTDDQRDRSDSEPHRVLLPACNCLESLTVFKSSMCVKISLALMLVSMLSLDFLLIYGIIPLEAGRWWIIFLVALASLGVLFFLFVIWIHKQTLQTAMLMLPCVPLIPSMAVFACLGLLVANSTMAGWIGCLLLLLLAITQYLTYGIRHSKLNDGHTHEQQSELTAALLNTDDDDDL